MLGPRFLGRRFPHGWQKRDTRANSSLPQMPPCEYNPLPYKGIGYDVAIDVSKNLLNPSVTRYYKKPVMINQGHMQWLWDHRGKRYLDMLAGIVTVSVGHCHPKVNRAAREQMDLLWHTTNIYMHPRIHEYAEKLTQRLPKNLKVCLFCNSGSEANDMAMVMARLYTGAFDLISLRNSYHGSSPYTMGLCGVGTWKYMFANGFGIHHAMNPDPYRGEWGGSQCRDSPVQTDRKCTCLAGQCHASDKYLEQLEEILSHSLPRKRIAGFIAESIQGVGGSVQFPSSYLRKAYEKIRARGGVCIADEVQTGFGRTGDDYWGFQMHGVIPDIVTMAKGMGNGFPIAAVVTSPEIAQTLTEARHFNTFGGNPVACAVGSAVVDVIDEEKCMENSRNVGTHMLLSLGRLRDEFESVGDVRGKGLMVGMELVVDKESRRPLPATEVGTILDDCKEMGLLIGSGGNHGNVLRVKPPMCVSKADADFCVAVIRRALENHASTRK